LQYDDAARATEVAWREEFECKLKRKPPKESEKGCHWRTSNESIIKAHEELSAGSAGALSWAKASFLYKTQHMCLP